MVWQEKGAIEPSLELLIVSRSVDETTLSSRSLPLSNDYHRRNTCVCVYEMESRESFRTRSEPKTNANQYRDSRYVSCVALCTENPGCNRCSSVRGCAVYNSLYVCTSSPRPVWENDVDYGRQRCIVDGCCGRMTVMTSRAVRT